MTMMSKKPLFNLLVLAMVTTSSYAVNTDEAFSKQTKSEAQQRRQDNNGNMLPTVSSAYPLDTRANMQATSPQILKDRFELGISPNFTKNVIKNKDRYSRVLTETIDTNLLADSVVKQIKNTDILYLHPHFMTTIAFPVDTEILYASSSLTMDKFDMAQNLLIIQPPKDFTNANILVTFRDEYKTYYTNIIVQKYTQYIYKDNKLKHYVIDDNYLSLNYNYVRNVEYSPIEILKTYFRLNGDKILKEFRQDGYYDIILIGGVSFYITRDSRFGTIDYKNMRFNVSQQYEFADKSLLGVKVGSDNFIPGIDNKLTDF